MKRFLFLLALCALPCLAFPTVAPDVALSDMQGKPVQLSELVKEKPVCLVWWCSTCPSCRTVDASLAELAGKANLYAVAASKGETPHSVEAFNHEHGYKIPVLFDQRWALTEPFGVKATTTALILDKSLQVRYYGRFLENDRAYAREAYDEVAQGLPVSHPRTQPFGCMIPKP